MDILTEPLFWAQLGLIALAVPITRHRLRAPRAARVPARQDRDPRQSRFQRH
ncbi:MAG: hypothetical protein ACK5IB_03805 [Qingshengfaniella sp.]